MTFHLDINKAISAAACLLHKAGGVLDLNVLLKMLYLADRTALLDFGRTITGDRFVATDQGPVPAAIHDLILGKGQRDYLKRWKTVFHHGDDHTVGLQSMPELGYLSEREETYLDSAFATVSSMPVEDRARWMHETFPEWQNPNGASIPIDPNQILRKAGRTEREIAEIEEEVAAVNLARTLLG